MSEKLYEALEVCLNALETGADLGSVLKRFPDLEDELAPILEASQQARILAIPEVPEKAYQRGRMRVLQHANAMRNPATKPRQRWAMFSFPRLAASLAVAFVLMLSGTGLVRAADTALPGDKLYSVKRTWEDVRLVLSFDPEIRGELEDEFEDERLHEIDELLAEPGYADFKDLLARKYSDHRGIIDMYFDSMMSDADDAEFVTPQIQDSEAGIR